MSFVLGASNQSQYGVDQIAGAVTANSDGIVNGTLSWNLLGMGEAKDAESVAGSWTIDATGRATLLSLTDGASFTESLHLYLAGDGNALLLSNSGSASLAGQAFQQGTGALTAASFSGNYGLNAGTGSFDVAGSISSVAGSSGTDMVTGFADSGDGAADFAISGSLTTAANGILTGTLAGLEVASPAPANKFTFYLVDQNRAVVIETDNVQATLGFIAALN